MELTIEQALKQANEVLKKDNLEEAERLYRIILKVSPKNVYANHNLATTLVKLYQSKNALPFFMTAIEENKTIKQFWASYIDALICLDELDKAKEIIELTRKEGWSDDIFTSLSQRLLSPVLLYSKRKMFKAADGHYLGFLRALHKRVYEGYFEIGVCGGSSLALSQSPSVAIDPFIRLTKDPIGKKEFCLIYQETSDSFFENRMPKLSGLKCQLAFIDGLHLFENALKDFINLAKISSKKALFLFHDPIPWTFKMTSRNYMKNELHLGTSKAWTGDIWKLVHIFIDAGMKNNLSLLSSAPSGILAVLNPDKEIITKLEQDYDKICAKWLNVELNEENILNFYEIAIDILIKPEKYLRSLEQMSLGNEVVNISKESFSQ